MPIAVGLATILDSPTRKQRGSRWLVAYKRHNSSLLFLLLPRVSISRASHPCLAAAVPLPLLAFVDWPRSLPVASCSPLLLLLLVPSPPPRSPPLPASATMSNPDITIPPELHQDVSEWTEDDVEMFLVANMERYHLEDIHVRTIRMQGVCGTALLLLDREIPQEWNINLGPALCIESLVGTLKATKALVKPGK